MPHRPGTNGKGQEDHTVLKSHIINDIDPKNGEARGYQRQHGAVNGTGYRGTHSQRIPIDSQIHGAKIKQTCNFVANFLSW